MDIWLNLSLSLMVQVARLESRLQEAEVAQAASKVQHSSTSTSDQQEVANLKATISELEKVSAR